MATIVLIPGLMNDGAVWAAMLGPLSRRAPVFVACNDGFDDLGRMAGHILHATAGALLVAGHSMGGRVALEVAARAPERMAALALVSTGAHPPGADEADGRTRLVDLARAHGMGAVAAAWLPPMMAAEPGSEAGVDVATMLARCPADHFAAQQRALLARPDRRDLLATIACPTLVMTGAEDRWASPAQHRAMAEAIPGATLAIVPKAGHMLPVEAPGETAARLLELFGRVG